jgi:hypothetical protein
LQGFGPYEYLKANELATESYVNAVLDVINVKALKEIAKNLRNGVPCQIPVLDISEKSTRFELVENEVSEQNIDLDMVFEDGVVWTARIKLELPTMPPETVRAHIFRSEGKVSSVIAALLGLFPRSVLAEVQGRCDRFDSSLIDF